MEKQVARKTKEAQNLQERIAELERQLAESERQREEMARLHELEQARLTAALDPLPVGVWIANPDGRVIGKNEMADKIWAGSSLSSGIHDDPHYEAWNPETGRQLQREEYPLAQVLRTGEAVEPIELGIRRFDGSQGTILASAAPIKDELGVMTGVIGVNVDITDRRRAEQERRLAEERYSRLFNSVREGFAHYKAMYDDEGNIVDLLIVEINPAGAELSGVVREAQVGRTWRQVWPGVDQGLFVMYQRADKTGEPLRFEDDNKLTKRIYDVLISRIAPGEFVVTFNDITQRKKTEESLREITRLLELDQARLAAILQHLPVGVWIADQHGRLVGINEQAERIWGGEAPLANNAAEYQKYIAWRPQTGQQLKPEEYPLAVALQTGKPVEPVELSIRRFDGAEGTVLVSAVPIKDRLGTLTGAVAVNVDITDRKTAEEALEASRNRVNDILKSLDDGLFALDRSWSFIYINEAAIRITGRRRDELVGKTIWDLWPQLRGTELETVYRRAMSDGVPGQLRAQGVESGRWYDVNVYPSSEGITVFYVDKTEQIQAEQSLRETEERFSKAFQRAPFGMNITRWQDGVFIDVNDAWLQMLGWTREEMIGKTTADIGFYAQPEDREIVRRRIMNDETLSDLELHVRRKDGSGLIITAATTLIELQGERCILSVVNDITERKRAEERFNQAFHASPNALVISRQNDGLIETVNDTFVKFFGYSREEVIGTTSVALGMFASPQDRQEAVSRLQRDGSLRDFELDVRLKSGETRHASLSVEMLTIGGESKMLTTIQDITLRKKAEAALRESEQRYRSLFETMQEGLVAAEIITDENGKPADYRYLDVNPATERQFGMPRERFIGHTYREVLPEGDPEWIDIFGKVARTGEPMSVERYGRASKRWFECHLYSPRPGHVINILTDITERKQFEISLRKRESILAQAGEMALLGAWDIELENQDDLNANPLTWSDEVYRIFGYAPGEVQPSNDLFFERVHPDDRALVQEGVAHALATRQPYAIEHRIRRTDGEERIVQEHAEIFFDESGKPVRIVGAVQDITERKRAEEARRESEERSIKAFHASPNAILISRLADGLILEVNDGWKTMFGHEQNEVLGRTSIEVGMYAHPEDRKVAVSRLLKTGMLRDFEADVRRKSGEIRHASLSAEKLEIGDTECLLMVISDITERKQTEQALRESEARFRSLADSMPQLVWTALPDGTVDYYNQRYQEYREIKQVEGTAWEWAPVLHPDDLQPTVDVWQHSLKTGEIYQIEHRVRMADDSYRWHLSRGVPMVDEQQRIVRWFGTATDIHDLKVAEEKLKVNTEQLERSNRELEQFAFMASHDMQEPLRKIEMFGDLLQERATSLGDQERAYLDRMRSAARRMRDMVEGLLQLSRISTQGQPFVTVNLTELTSEVLHDLEDQIRRTASHVDLLTLPRIEGDPLQLRQLMQNLIENALKYRKPGAPAEVRIHARELPGKVQIYMEDQGIGFAQEDAERIFEPFHRLVGRSEYGGSGIGLAICRRIVERHAGQIVALSQPEQGTTFVVTLPVHQPEAANATA
jgi:PAS domain S-box-containing protein